MTPSKFWSALALKHLEESGTFYGYASVFNVTDQQKERVAPGAFRKTLEQCHQQQLWPKLLWQHDPTQPIGTWIDIREDNIGLFVHGKLLMSVQKGLEAHALLKAQALNGLSIGFTPVESHIDVTTQCRVLTAVNLHEISLVTYPANQHATITQIKQGDINMPIPNLSTLEAQESHLSDKLERLTQTVDYAHQRLSQLAQAPHLLPQPLPSDSQTMKAAFLTYIRQGNDDSLRQYKNLSVQNDPDGGYAVPPEMLAQIISTTRTLSPLRRLMRVETITSDAVEMLLDKDYADAGWVTETEARPETKTPELAKVRIPVHELYARCRATQKLLDDACINIEDWLVDKVSNRLAQLENHAFIYGDGLRQPRGILSYPTTPAVHEHPWGKIGVIKTGKAGAFHEDNPANVLIKAIEWLETNYLANACWLMSRRTLAEVRCLRFEHSGYLWQPSLQALTPDTLLGYPVVCCDEMPTLADNSISILFGDFKSAYQIVDRQGIRILRDPFTAKPYVELYITKRVGGDVINFDAIKGIKFAA